MFVFTLQTEPKKMINKHFYYGKSIFNTEKRLYNDSQDLERLKFKGLIFRFIKWSCKNV